MTVTIDVSTPNYPGLVALIDDQDQPLITGDWTILRGKRTFYAARGRGSRNNRRYWYMHRVILGITDPKVQADHINGNGLDNRRVNLRIVTNKQNSHNSRPHRDGSSKYRGVSWDQSRRRWRAQYAIDGRPKFLGRFDSEVEAAKAYDDAVLKRSGEFAYLNFPVAP
jgi:hypothetical protein